MRRPLTLTALFFAASLGAAQNALAWELAKTPEVTFKATGPAGFKINGTAKALKLAPEEGGLAFEVPLAEVDTGMSLRNRHMLEDLEAAKFPVVRLFIPTEAIPASDPGTKSKGKLDGRLELHGVTRPIQLDYEMACETTCKVEAQGQIDMRAHDLKIRSYLGITVKNDVGIAAKLELSR